MENLKSYLSEEEKKGLTPNLRYLSESGAAGEAGDEETAWAWLRLATLPAYALLSFKHRRGAEVVRQSGLNLSPAEAAYGKDWLEREI